MSDPQPQVDPQAYQERLDRITELFSSMMDRVEVLSTQRCPYKNRHDRCTANFGCRNQRKPANPDELRHCGGDDKLDYRKAWESS